MLSDQFVAELRAVFQAQHDLLRRARTEVEALEAALAPSDVHADQIAQLERELAEIELRAEDLTPEDFAEFDPQEILALYEERRQRVVEHLDGLACTSWPAFVRACEAHDLANGLDPLAPYEMFLSPVDHEQLRATAYGAQFAWDRWDYVLVGVSGILAALVDLFLIRIPKAMTCGGQPQAGSPLTAWLKQYDIHDPGRQDWFASWARHLEKTCRAPYDAMQGIPGMTGRSHRFQSLGHDPVLGLCSGCWT
ncbi:MAG: hypothetical protein ABMA64_00265 [Myxococcota bacterium]